MIPTSAIISRCQQVCRISLSLKKAIKSKIGVPSYQKLHICKSNFSVGTGQDDTNNNNYAAHKTYEEQLEEKENYPKHNRKKLSVEDFEAILKNDNNFDVKNLIASLAEIDEDSDEESDKVYEEGRSCENPPGTPEDDFLASKLASNSRAYFPEDLDWMSKEKSFSDEKYKPVKPAKYYMEESHDEVDLILNTRLLRQFLCATGRIRPRRFTGLSAKHQRKINRAIKSSKALGLLPYTSIYPVPSNDQWEEIVDQLDFTEDADENLNDEDMELSGMNFDEKP